MVNDPAEDGTSVHDTHSETSETVTRNGTIVAAFNDSLLISSSPIRLTGWSVSTDGGQTFVDKGSLPGSSFGGDLGDPSLAADLVSGRVYLATISGNDQQINVFRSDDNGNTFQPAVAGAPGTGGDDKEWIAVDNASGAGQGNVYLVMHDLAFDSGIYLFRSTDQGATFGPGGGVQIVRGINTVQGAWVAVGPDHAVYAFWYDAAGHISMRKSTNQGQSFGPAVTVTTLRTTGFFGDLGLGGFRSNAFPQAIVNPANGSIYVTFNDKGTTPGDRANVYFTQSNDGGTTWSAPVRVNDGPVGRDAWQPTITVSPSGSKVGIFWYDRRNDPANNLIDRYGDLGVVAGPSVTFAPNFRITDVSFPPVFGVDPGIASNYMGDYDQAIATSNSFGTTWGDNRDPSRGHGGNHANVRFARIPVDVAGPSVIAISLNNSTFAPVDHFRVTFDEPILIGSATPDQFSVTDPFGNPVNVSNVAVVPGSNDQQFDVSIDVQTVAGAYTVTIGPHIQDTAGHEMDQDGDGNPVGQKDDVFNGGFTIVGPSVLSTTLTGRYGGQVDHGRVVFNTAIDPNSFGFDQFNLLDPNGKLVNVDSITAVDKSNTKFDVTFDPQTAMGFYQLTIGPNITDAFANPMPAAYTGQFEISDELLVNGDFETGTFSGWGTAVTSFTFVGNSPNPPHNGRFCAELGAAFGAEHFWQDLTTTPGQSYHISFWYFRQGGNPADLHVTWGGVEIYSEINSAAHPYILHEFDVLATGTTTRLDFGARNVDWWDALDDVSVRPTGTATASGGTLAGKAALLSTAPAPAQTPALRMHTSPDLTLVPALPQNLPPAIPAPASPAAKEEEFLALRKSQDAIDGVFASGLDDWNASFDSNRWPM